MSSWSLYLCFALLLAPTPTPSQQNSLLSPVDEWRFEDVFSIGADPNSISFTAISSIAFGNSNQVLILDGPSAELIVLDENGEHLQTIGRRGQGPGEFVGPSLVTATPDGSILVYDAGTMRFSVFDANGNFKSSWLSTLPFLTPPLGMVSVSEHIVTMMVFPARVRIAGNESSTIDGPNIPRLVRHDRNGATKNIWEFSDLEVRALKSAQEIRAMRIRLFAPRAVWGGLSGNRFVVGRNDEYRLTILDDEGTVVGEIFRDVEQREVPSERITEILSQMPEGFDARVDLDGFLPIIISVHAGPQEAILVVRGDIDLADGTTMDVFSGTDTAYLGSVVLPEGFVPMVAQNDRLAGLQADAEDNVVRVLRIRQ